MSEIFEEVPSSESKTDSELEDNRNKETVSQLIEKIRADQSLDMDTKENAKTAAKLFSVDFDDAIKISEVVNLLWEGQRRFIENEDESYSLKTKPYHEFFKEKVFPIANNYKNIEDIFDIPKEIIEDIEDFKNNFQEYELIDKFSKEEESRKLLSEISDKLKGIENESEFKKNPEWMDIINKLDQVDIDFETLKKDFRAVKITEALILYDKKQKHLSERIENGSDVCGFENCDEFSNEEIEEFMENNFGQELLAKSLTRDVRYSPKFRISFDGNHYTEKEYLEMEKKNPSIKDRLSRGGTGRAHAFPSDVGIFNHRHGDISNYRYLDSYEENDKIKAYLLGTIVHEIGGHHYFDARLKLSERNEWEKVCQKEESEEGVTCYVEKIKKGLFGGNIYSEDFSDSMRRFMTDYDEFKKEFPMRVEFIEKKFPEIIENGIKNFLNKG